MAAGSGWAYRDRAVVAFEPVSEMLDIGSCEPLKAAVHGVLMTTVAVCAAYNTAAWLKRRQRHLAINAVVYTLATIWERAHVVHHLSECEPVTADTASPLPAFEEPADTADRHAA
jgi:hypothetical protein